MVVGLSMIHDFIIFYCQLLLTARSDLRLNFLLCYIFQFGTCPSVYFSFSLQFFFHFFFLVLMFLLVRLFQFPFLPPFFSPYFSFRVHFFLEFNYDLCFISFFCRLFFMSFDSKFMSSTTDLLYLVLT